MSRPVNHGPLEEKENNKGSYERKGEENGFTFEFAICEFLFLWVFAVLSREEDNS